MAQNHGRARTLKKDIETPELEKPDVDMVEGHGCVSPVTIASISAIPKS